MVPVVRNVENMNFADIERAIYDLGEKVRKVGKRSENSWEEWEELGVLDRHILIQSLYVFISDL